MKTYIGVKYQKKLSCRILRNFMRIKNIINPSNNEFPQITGLWEVDVQSELEVI